MQTGSTRSDIQDEHDSLLLLLLLLLLVAAALLVVGELEGRSGRRSGLAMAFKLIEAASKRWRYVNGPHLVALVRARCGGAARRGEG